MTPQPRNWLRVDAQRPSQDNRHLLNGGQFFLRVFFSPGFYGHLRRLFYHSVCSDSLTSGALLTLKGLPSGVRQFLDTVSKHPGSKPLQTNRQSTSTRLPRPLCGAVTAGLPILCSNHSRGSLYTESPLKWPTPTSSRPADPVSRFLQRKPQ